MYLVGDLFIFDVFEGAIACVVVVDEVIVS